VTASLTDAVREHHAELRRKFREKADAWLQTGSPEALQDLANFLSGELLGHARAEEAHLYPAVEPLVKAWGRATATMSIDHEFIEDYIRRIQAWPDPETCRELVLGLQAIFTLHLEKEERVYLPLIADHLSAEEQARVLAQMHAGSDPDAGAGESAEATLDVRAVPPRERHPLIFATFDSLRPGQAFILVNDHDPKPLYYQLSAERPGAFEWTYLEQGPEVWRVRIGRRQD
jgi:uncharacterized protein (DUF2249 family)/hemerythrin superfamily protein